MWQCLQIIHILSLVYSLKWQECLERVVFKCDVFINDQKIALNA